QTRSGDPLDIMNAPEDLPPYVGMATPDGAYYVGLDVESMLHPQSLLAYEINGAPLTDEHGAPLRLVTPVKYGVKNLKRIGTIRYSRARPADYWAEEGYDWYIVLCRLQFQRKRDGSEWTRRARIHSVATQVIR